MNSHYLLNRTTKKIAALIALLAGISASFGNEPISITVPGSLAGTEGQGASAGFAVKFRLQEAYGASLFPSYPIIIQEIRFRPDITYAIGAFSGTIQNIKFRLSTTSRPPNALSSVFDENLGSDVQEVYSGPWTISTAFTGPTIGPKQFDMVLPLQRPFRYDPRLGNLLLEYKNYSGLPKRLHTDAASDGSLPVGLIFTDGDPNASSASARAPGADLLEIRYTADTNIPPVILTPPLAQTVDIGASPIFGISYAGPEPMAFQWLFNGSPLLNATNRTLTVTNSQLSSAGMYSVIVSNNFGTVTSSPALLQVYPPATEARIIPTSLNNAEGAGASAGFSNPFRLQEVYSSSQFLPVPIVIREIRFRPDITFNVGPFGGVLQDIRFNLSTTPRAPGGLSSVFADNLSADVTEVFKGTWAFSTSFEGPASGPKNSDISLKLTKPFRYDPSRGNLLLEYRNYSSFPLRIHTDAASQAGGPVSMIYTDRSPDAVTAFTSTPGADAIQILYSIDEDAPPAIAQNPRSQTIVQGNSLSLDVVAAGSPPLAYQWFFKGVAIPEATNSSLTRTGITIADDGVYSVVVSNKNGTARSLDSAVSVAPAPQLVLTLPSSLESTNGDGGSATLSVPMRQQELYASKLFPEGPISIEQLRFRVDEKLGAKLGAFSITIPRVEIRMSTSTNQPGGLNSKFKENVGVDETTVYDGALLLSSQGVNVRDNSSPFDIVIVLKKPFVYDSTKGSLLVETKNYSRLDRLYPIDANAQGGLVSRIFIEDPASEFASGGDNSAAVLQFGYSYVSRAPEIIRNPQDQEAVVGAAASFSALATGSRPLSYQWLFNGQTLDGATSSSLSLSNVTFANAGVYTLTVSNELGSVASSDALLTVKLGPTKVRIINATVGSGGFVDCGVEIVANGNENGVAFSLLFDPSALQFDRAIPNDFLSDASLNLNTNSLGNGVLGFAVALNSNETIPTGTNILTRIRFRATPFLKDTITQLTFTSDPVLEEVVDSLAHPLPSTFSGGSVSILFRGFESDVAPRALPDKKLTLADWVQTGRFVAGLDDVASPEEFQRVDCAPRESSGDGRITIRDWVQAGRYVAGLDPITVVGGPMTNADLTPPPPLLLQSTDVSKVCIVETNGSAGDLIKVPVTVTTTGTEAALGFSVQFDTSKLVYSGVDLGKDAAGSLLNVNSKRVESGRIGVALSLPSGAQFSAGNKQIALLKFTIPSVRAGVTELSFADSPISRELVNSSAGLLTADYTSAAITIAPGAPELTVQRSSDSLSLSWPSAATGFVVESSPTLNPAVWSAVGSTPEKVGDLFVVHLSLGDQQGYFRIRKSP